VAALALVVCGLVMLRLWPTYALDVRADTANKLESHRKPLALWGHGLPALAGATVLMVGPPALPLAVPIALLAIAGGAFMKFQLIVRAAHFQGLRIPTGQPAHQSPALNPTT
jgi:hypothetical protein